MGLYKIQGNIVQQGSHALTRVELPKVSAEDLALAIAQSLESGTMTLTVRDDASPKGRFKPGKEQNGVERERGNAGFFVAGYVSL